MATEEKYSLSPEMLEWLGGYLNRLGVESIEELRQKSRGGEGGKTEIVKVETNFYNKEEIYPDCTVQVLTNTATGETSVGWRKNGD